MFNTLKNNTLIQIMVFNTVGQLLGAALMPYAQAISNQVWNLTPIVPLSPAQLAELVERGEISEAEGAAQARLNGIDAERFHLMTRAVGQPPAPGQLVEALRRGLIDDARFKRGIRQGAVRVEWEDVFRGLAMQTPEPGAILAALLEGQIERPEAERLYRRLGGDPDYFDLLYNTGGQAPTPLQAVEMANRGVIPWDGTGPEVVSYTQAFREGPWRNKWEEPFRALAEYLPPPRTVTAMYREGSISRARAAELLRKGGLPEDLIGAYLQQGSQEKTADDRKLAVSTTTTLYLDQLISRTDAAALIVALGYEDDEAELLLSMADLRITQRFLNLAIGRVRTFYVGRKIDKAAAVSALARFNVTAERASSLLALWDWERAANVKQLTAAEVFKAWKLLLIGQPEALSMLADLGYTPRDAALYLSIHAGGLIDGGIPADDTTDPT